MALSLVAILFGAGPTPVAVVESVRLEYAAHEGCPSASRLFEEVAGRTDRVRHATEAEAARAFRVTVSREGDGSHARLDITGLDGAVTSREVTANDCAEAVSAIALIAALAIDPDASTEMRSPGETSTAVAPAPAGPATSIPAPPAPPPTALVAPGPVGFEGTTQPSRTSDRAAGSEWSLGAEGEAVGGLVPSWALGGGAYVAFAPFGSDPLLPSFRASAFVVAADTTFQSPVGAAVTWFLSRVEMCPVRPTLRSDVIIELCAALDAGAMRVAGKGLIDPDSKVYPWFSVGGGARLVWWSSERIELGFGPAFTVPLRRYPFQYDDPAVSRGPLEAYRIPPVALALTLGAGYRFP